MVGEKTLMSAAMQKRTSDQMSTGLRPYLSLMGPRMNWPMARPAMPVVSPSCTVDTEQLKNFIISGSAGTYMSLTKEPKALNPARYIIRKV